MTKISYINVFGPSNLWLTNIRQSWADKVVDLDT